MGIITDHLSKQIERRVLANHLVVWFDPGSQYAKLAQLLTLPQTSPGRRGGSVHHASRGLLALSRARSSRSSRLGRLAYCSRKGAEAGGVQKGPIVMDSLPHPQRSRRSAASVVLTEPAR